MPSHEPAGLPSKMSSLRGLEQVLPHRRHRQLGVGSRQPEIPHAVQAEETLHRPEPARLPCPRRRGVLRRGPAEISEDVVLRHMCVKIRL